MRSTTDVAHAQQPRTRLVMLLAPVLSLAGFVLTLVVFYPGVMTFDARYIYADVKSGTAGDWQSPVMVWLWGLIDPIAPGPGSLLLLTVALYWLSFAILGAVAARRAAWAPIVLPLLGLMPPAFVLLGILWRDILLAAVWLLAAAIVYAALSSPRPMRIAIQAGALMLLAIGVLLRPNALLAAPVLAAYLIWPQHFSWKRSLLLFVPAALAGFVLIQVVYYGVLGAARQHPLQSIMVFDLGGITHFAGRNQFPVTWTPEQAELLTGQCYRPVEWNIYWTDDRCRFVMDRLEHEKLFGTPAIVRAWARALAAHPIAYLRHRAAFFWNFLAARNFSMWTFELDAPSRTVFADSPAFMATKALHDALYPTPLFRAGLWLLLNLVVCAGGWRRRATPEGAFALAVAGSAAVYMLTFLVVGVASDFRYAYWPILAAMTGGVIARVPGVRRS